jgi:integrase
MPQPFKHPTTHVYYYRRKVPKELGAALGREYKRSLGTKDLEEAKNLFRAEDARCEQTFALARAQAGAGTSPITPDDARQLASRWYSNESMRLDKMGRFTEWLAEDASVVDPRDGTETFLYTTLREGWERDGEGWPTESMARPHIVSALRGSNVPLPDKDSAAWAWLVAQFDDRIHQLSAWALSRHEGGKALPGEGALPRALLSTEMPTAVAAPTRSGKKISETFSAYEANKLAGDNSRSVKASLDDYRASITTFVELFGDVDLSSITRTLVSEYRVDLPKLPANAKRMKALSARERIELAERDRLPTIAAGTVRNRMRHLSAVLTFAVSRGWMQENPVNAAGVGRDVARTATKQQTAKGGRKGYTVGQLAAIFASVAFTDDAWTPPRAAYGRAWYWLPVLMYYSGARVEELAQLRASEVVKPEGIDCLSILASIDEEDGDRTVKTASSRRMIPLHPDAMARGFLEYVKSVPSGGMLFPSLEPCPKGRYSTNFAKRWSVYLRDVVRLKSAASPSHGFRHAFKTLARDADIQTEVSDAITGHAGEGVGRSYGEMPLRVTAEAIARIPSISDIIEQAKASEE